MWLRHYSESGLLWKHQNLWFTDGSRATLDRRLWAVCPVGQMKGSNIKFLAPISPVQRGEDIWMLSCVEPLQLPEAVFPEYHQIQDFLTLSAEDLAAPGFSFEQLKPPGWFMWASNRRPSVSSATEILGGEASCGFNFHHRQFRHNPPCEGRNSSSSPQVREQFLQCCCVSQQRYRNAGEQCAWICSAGPLGAGSECQHGCWSCRSLLQQTRRSKRRLHHMLCRKQEPSRPGGIPVHPLGLHS